MEPRNSSRKRKSHLSLRSGVLLETCESMERKGVWQMPVELLAGILFLSREKLVVSISVFK